MKLSEKDKKEIIGKINSSYRNFKKQYLHDWPEYPDSNFDVSIPKEFIKKPLASNVTIKNSTYLTSKETDLTLDIQKEITEAIAKKVTASMEQQYLDYGLVQCDNGFRAGDLVNGYTSGMTSTIVDRTPLFENVTIENPGDLNTLKI